MEHPDEQTQIEAGPARRAVTAADVARHLGVSRSTVSYVLTGNARQLHRIPTTTRERVHAAAAELGYVPSALARGLRSGHAPWVVVVLPADPFGPALAELVDTLMTDLVPDGLDVVVRREGGEDLTTLVAQLSPTAVVSLVPVEERVRARLAAVGVVVLDATVDRPSAPGCRSMHRLAGAVQREHLVATGCTRVVHVAPADTRLDDAVALRHEGAMDRLIGVDAELRRVQDDTDLLVDLDGGSSGRPVGFMCFDDALAVRVLDEALRRGWSVPDRLAVVGCDDSPASQYAVVPLPSVDLRGAERALWTTSALRTLLTPLEEPTGGSFADLVPRLVERPLTRLR